MIIAMYKAFTFNYNFNLLLIIILIFLIIVHLYIIQTNICHTSISIININKNI